MHFSVAQIDVICKGKLGVSFFIVRLPPRAAGDYEGHYLPPTRLGQTGRSIQSSLGMAFIHVSKAN